VYVWRSTLVTRNGWGTGQIASTLHPNLAKAIAKRGVVNHLEVEAIRMVGITYRGAFPKLPDLARSGMTHKGRATPANRNPLLKQYNLGRTTMPRGCRDGYCSEADSKI
jgi:hypothetical protein